MTPPLSALNNRANAPIVVVMNHDVASPPALWRSPDSGAAPSPPRSEAGMGLIELVVAISLLGFVMVALGAAMGASLTLTRSNRDRIVAANLASQELEKSRSVPFENLAPGSATERPTVDNVEYAVTRTVDWVNQATGESSTCSADSAQDFLRVSVAVTWPSMKIPPVRNQTIITPSKGAIDPNMGTIIVKVLDVEGEPAAGRTIRLSGGQPSATPVKTVPEGGCVYFGDLVPDDDYKVAMTDAGYVSGQGTEPVEEGIEVLAGKTQFIEMHVGHGVSMAVTITTTSPQTHAIPTSFPVTLGNDRIQPSKTVLRTGAGSPRAVDNLFPWSDGYSVWAGDCRDADPQGIRVFDPLTLYYPKNPAAVRPTPVDPSDGASVALTPVDLTFVVFTGSWWNSRTDPKYYSPLKNTDVYAVHADKSACPDAETRRYHIGTTNGSGVLRTSMPFGQWEFRARQGSDFKVEHTVPSSLPRIAPGSTLATNTFLVRVS